MSKESNQFSKNLLDVSSDGFTTKMWSEIIPIIVVCKSAFRIVVTTFFELLKENLLELKVCS